MVITVSSIKGGVGKSSVVLLLANNLASRGRKVLVIDTDLNNTVTVYYTMGIGRIGEICERQNVSLAFSRGKIDEKTSFTATADGCDHRISPAATERVHTIARSRHCLE